MDISHSPQCQGINKQQDEGAEEQDRFALFTGNHVTKW
jgi:hypothetical protein